MRIQVVQECKQSNSAEDRNDCCEVCDVRERECQCKEEVLTAEGQLNKGDESNRRLVAHKVIENGDLTGAV